ncbi:type II toxin-antitoxin system RelE/ParE family toxin [Desulfonatronum sp. SC1]|uniref:type II toxin-antitoxin system RelE family toxin n=1 Tax=Desulfonatronum sp. SC1 TaxID=2109626 RepID=UPI000D31BEB0|nr:type II toxin-antitoxin system RelE/ParE family toxin [Desulfonatronum sp. SC1]PTN32887.1 cytotoxin [Desulfonatronum sp. SC1]
MSRSPLYRLRVSDDLAVLIRGLHPELKRKVREALALIVENPTLGKPLKRELEGLRSFRVSRFRIIYSLTEKREIQIIAIGPRDRIYEETARIEKRE